MKEAIGDDRARARRATGERGIASSHGVSLGVSLPAVPGAARHLRRQRPHKYQGARPLLARSGHGADRLSPLRLRAHARSTAWSRRSLPLAGVEKSRRRRRRDGVAPITHRCGWLACQSGVRSWGELEGSPLGADLGTCARSETRSNGVARNPLLRSLPVLPHRASTCPGALGRSTGCAFHPRAQESPRARSAEAQSRPSQLSMALPQKPPGQHTSPSQHWFFVGSQAVSGPKQVSWHEPATHACPTSQSPSRQQPA